MSRACRAPGCRRVAFSKGLCRYHHGKSQRDEIPRLGASLAIFPRHPRHVRDALCDLAETPGLTLATYLARKARILEEAT